MKILLTKAAGGTYDVTELTASAQWSGNYKSCCRQMEVSVLAPGKSPDAPDVAAEPGDLLQLIGEDGEECFRGLIFRRGRATGDAVMSLTALDNGVILKQNQTYAKYKGMTPEGIASQLCGEFGVTKGDLAATGYSFTRTFFGVSLYDIIMTAYTEASRSSGKKYLMRFVGDAMSVVERKVTGDTLVLEGGASLMAADVDEDATAIVNRVKIVTDTHDIADTVEDAENIASFGVFQRIIKDGEDAADRAADLLRAGGLQQKITAQALGDVRCITGNMAVIHEPVTGLYGAYHIDSDTHTWKNGLHTMKLQLNFDAVMDEKEAGSLEKVDASGKKQKKKQKGSLSFIYKPIASEGAAAGMEQK